MLKNTVSQAGTVGTVKLSSLYFDEEAASISSMSYNIPQGNIVIPKDNNGYGRTYYLYATHPGKSNSVSNIGSFTTKSNTYTNSSSIELSPEAVNAILNEEEKGYFYVRYQRSSNKDYYVAKVKLEDVLNEETRLIFVKQN